MPPDKKHWTNKVHRNERFEKLLKKRHKHSFSNADAYEIRYAVLTMKGYTFWRKRYANRTGSDVPEIVKATIRDISNLREFVVNDEFFRMNVRNLLAKMVYMGLIERVEPGTYIWRTV